MSFSEINAIKSIIREYVNAHRRLVVRPSKRETAITDALKLAYTTSLAWILSEQYEVSHKEAVDFDLCFKQAETLMRSASGELPALDSSKVTVTDTPSLYPQTTERYESPSRESVILLTSFQAKRFDHGECVICGVRVKLGHYFCSNDCRIYHNKTTSFT